MMAAAETLLLKGRYINKVIKYGALTGVATTLSGIATYLVVRKRTQDSEEYIRSLTPELHKKCDERLMKYAGFDRNEKFPHVPFLNNEEGEFDGFYKKFDKVDRWLVIEKTVLSAVDPTLKDFFPDLFLNGIRSNWFDSKSKKAECQEKLTAARYKLFMAVEKDLKNFKGKKQEDIIKMIKAMPADKMLISLYFLELAQQRRSGRQKVSTPLAVNYLPRKPDQD